MSPWADTTKSETDTETDVGSTLCTVTARDVATSPSSAVAEDPGTASESRSAGPGRTPPTVAGAPPAPAGASVALTATVPSPRTTPVRAVRSETVAVSPAAAGGGAMASPSTIAA